MQNDQLYTLTDMAIAGGLGKRLAALRVRRGVRQIDVASGSGLSESTIKKLEKGKGTLLNLIAVLRELNALAELEQLLPEPAVSPMQLLKSSNRPPQRVRIKSVPDEHANEPDEDVQW